MSIICLETDRKRSYFLCLFVLLTVKDETMSEKERDRLEDELTKRDDMEGNVDLLQRQLDGEMQLVVSN